ncbi:PAS domain-containing protein, partial [Glaciimonas sp. Cout2]|uniref:PAS domain-containing protein n=1 Tax=Glaciimonas sp. Cout2 TaxID=3048621 RepID=UPI002B23BEFF
MGKTVFDLSPTDAAKISHNADRKVIESGSVLESQSVVAQEDGEHIYQIIRTPLYRSSGEIYGVCVIGIDISQRLASEQKMRVGEDLL